MSSASLLRHSMWLASVLVAAPLSAQLIANPPVDPNANWCGFDELYELPSPKAARKFIKEFAQEISAVRDGNLVFAANKNVVRAADFSASDLQFSKRSLCARQGPYKAICGNLREALAPLPLPNPSGAPVLQMENDAIWKLIGIKESIDTVASTRRAKVAVIDTGVFAHREFDRKGVPPSVLRWYSLDPAKPDADCGGGSCCRQTGPETVSASHGTHVAGLIAAASDGIGISGLGNAKELMSISALDKTRKCFSRRKLFEAYKCAVERRADIINISMQSEMFRAYPAELETVINQGVQRDSSRTPAPLIVIAAGNSECNFSRHNCGVWPAGMNLSTIVTVEALELSLARVSNTNRGNGVDLGVPAPAMGATLCTTDSKNPTGPNTAACDNGYLPFGETSAAAAVVTGAASRVWGHPNFDRCNAAELRRVLRGYGKPTPPELVPPNEQPSCQLRVDFLYDIHRDKRRKALNLCQCLPPFDEKADASECGRFREKPLCQEAGVAAAQ